MAARLEQADADERALEATRRDLVAWASHDLRTPLASLRAMLDALADGVVSDPETVARYLHQSQSEIGRMSSLIDDLFELAQLDAGSLVLRGETSSLSDLDFRHAGRLFRPRPGAQIELTGAVAPVSTRCGWRPTRSAACCATWSKMPSGYTPAGGQMELQARLAAGRVPRW